MKKVSEQEWRDKAAGLAEWRKKRTSPPNLELYKRIVSMVHVGNCIGDIGAGQCHLQKCLPEGVLYDPSDPYPIVLGVSPYSIEDLNTPNMKRAYDTVFMLSALDNVRDLTASLVALKHIARENIVILTGIGIPPDQNHTVQVDRKDLTDVLGEPFQEVELLPKVYLFEWRL